jgi:hypothetical protein
MVEVTIMENKQFTQAKEDIGTTGVCTWGEHLFFEPRNVEVHEIEDAKITIRVLDKGFLRDNQIGDYEFDVAYIYS